MAQNRKIKGSEMKRTDFPWNFVFGAATSGYQVEGGGYAADWHYAGLQNRVPLANKACDHVRYYPSDLQILKDLGLNGYRMGIEWPRMEPNQGAFSKDALSLYREIIQATIAKGITPNVTLSHFTLPQWLAKQGGWENPYSVRWFANYARICANEFGPVVTYWSTLNEPKNVYIPNAYIAGLWPPFKKSPVAALRAFINLRAAHFSAYKAMKEVSPKLQIGIVENYGNVAASNIALKPIARLINLFSRSGFTTGDWLGVNYYRSYELSGAGLTESQDRTDVGWGIDPSGLAPILKKLWNARHLPMYVTENGLANVADDKRWTYIYAHLEQVLEAMDAGVDMRGYFHWSLLDNFEWALGYRPRFGLVEVNYTNMKRTPRPSALQWRDWLTDKN